ncbi:Glycerophosphoryl diester phosphodiesterase [Arthrobacter saudimassiliensis]|uniref:Glycerophosphoryl diester phosphodiesterase n=1 Tax=Arthrobacter saudimassiliensis TaxID=1461584 RepID=A0A078MQQ4_9MICC|nr:Glycerophosphoryl diester phosphodiesterase [Arthrobacter saudimassiliensis]
MPARFGYSTRVIPVPPYLRNPLRGSGPDAPRQAPIGLSHRGFSRSGAENTLPAFQAAVDLGFGWLETDVRTTADGVLLAFHDADLDRVSGSSGPVGNRTMRELADVRVGGQPVPTLEQLLAAWPHIRLNVDVKDAAGVAPLADLIRSHRAGDRVLVASFSDRRRLAVLRRLRRSGAGPVASSAGSAFTALAVLLAPLGGVGLLARLGRFQCLQVPRRYGILPVVTPALIRGCHRAGVQVHVWTINEREQMEQLLDAGVDGIVSDRADLLAEVLAARGCWPQG